MFLDHGNAELTDAENAEHDEPEHPGRYEPSQTTYVPTRRRSSAPRPAPRRAPAVRQRRHKVGLVAVVVGAVVLAFLATLSPVRTLLRQSFTRLPSTYTEMYFSGTPTVNGIDLTAPVTVVNHASQSNSFALKVWVVNGAGATETSTSMTVTPKRGEAKTVVDVAVKLPADGQVLWVSLVGQTQTLHYRFAGSAIATPAATGTPTARSTARK